MADAQNAAQAAANPAENDAKPALEAQAEAQSTTESKAAGDSKDTEKDSEKARDGDREANGRGADRARNDNRRGGDRNGGYRHHNGGNKKRNTEFEDLPETDDPDTIREQVNFYFSDSNLATDEFFYHLIDGPKNLPVPISKLQTFKRMRRFRPRSAIVAALRECESLIFLDEGEYSGVGNEAVQRKVPLKPVLRDGESESELPSTTELFYRHRAASVNLLANSLYYKGFGDRDVSQLVIEDFFRPYGATMVRKRRDGENNFKGSVFVEFPSEEMMKQFLELDPVPKFDENAKEGPLVMSKEAYMRMKCIEKGLDPEVEIKREQSRFADFRGGRGNNSRGRGRGRGGQRGGGHGRRTHDRRPNHRNRRDSDDRDSRDRDHVDSRDWNTRRDRFQKGKDDRATRKNEDSKEIERDAHGVPVVKDTRGEDDGGKKRKARDDGGQEDGAKKSKIEIKEDE